MLYTSFRQISQIYTIMCDLDNTNRREQDAFNSLEPKKIDLNL